MLYGIKLTDRQTDGDGTLPLLGLLSEPKMNFVIYTVCFFSLIFRNRAAVSLFLDLWATQRHPSDHKIGSK